MKKNSLFIIVIFLFLIINLIFNFSDWKKIFFRNNSQTVFFGDSSMAEFILENNYQHIKKGKNPFIFEKQLFHPFSSINVSLNDPGFSNVIFSFFLRPFLNSYKTITMVVLINIFLNNLVMFLLLKKLNITNIINIIISLVFGYLPIISYRVFGHYTYTSVYIFPLFFILVLKLFRGKSLMQNILTAISLGLLMTFIILLNFYYFIGIFFIIISYALYFLFNYRKIFINIFRNYFKFYLLILAIFFISVFPWIYSIYQLLKENGIEKTSGSAGVIELSGDLIGFFIPSEYNPIYKYLINKLANLHPLLFKFSDFYLNNIEKFNYIGLIIIISYIIIIFIKKKLTSEIWEKMKQHFSVSLIFALLTLGPFLKIFNRWYINLDGILVVLPLPFLFLRYISGLSSIRAPTRFTPIFIFLALIVSAYLFDHIYEKLKGNRKILFIIALFTIFVLDQYTMFPKQPALYFPLQIYKHVERSVSKGAVFEIPFTVRDGFRYIGFVHAIGPMNGQLIHKKPIIGGYIARLNSSIFDYYKNLKFISYVANIIDKGNYDPLKEKPRNINFFPYPYPINTAENELQSLNIKFIILKYDEKYSSYLASLFKKIGFIEKQKDNNYILLEK